MRSPCQESKESRSSSAFVSGVHISEADNIQYVEVLQQCFCIRSPPEGSRACSRSFSIRNTPQASRKYIWCQQCFCLKSPHQGSRILEQQYFCGQSLHQKSRDYRSRSAIRILPQESREQRRCNIFFEVDKRIY